MGNYRFAFFVQQFSALEEQDPQRVTVKSALVDLIQSETQFCN